MANICVIKELAAKLNLSNISKLNDFNTDLKSADYLEYLFKYELEERRKSVIEENKKQSKLPKININKEFIGVTNWNITNLEKLEWLENNENIFICGKCGSGKTALAVKLATTVLEKSNKVYYVVLDELLQILKEKDDSMKKKFEYLKKCDLIVIDEIMYLSITDTELQLLYRGLMFLNESRSIMFITNRNLSEWKDVVSDKHLMETFIDRLITGSRILNV